MVKDNVDFNVDPCESFYDFACGKFLTNRNVPNENPKVDLTDVMMRGLDSGLIGKRFFLQFDMIAPTCSTSLLAELDVLREPPTSKDINSTVNTKMLFTS